MRAGTHAGSGRKTTRHVPLSSKTIRVQVGDGAGDQFLIMPRKSLIINKII